MGLFGFGRKHDDQRVRYNVDQDVFNITQQLALRLDGAMIDWMQTYCGYGMNQGGLYSHIYMNQYDWNTVQFELQAQIPYNAWLGLLDQLNQVGWQVDPAANFQMVAEDTAIGYIRVR